MPERFRPFELGEDPPHKVIGKLLVDAMEGIEATGDTICKALDAAPQSVGLPEGPHRIVGNVLNTIGGLGKGIVKNITGVK